MGTVHDELDAAITTLLDVDPHDLSDDELSDTVVAIQRQTSRLAAARARLISAWDHRHLWATDGSRSPGARLSRDASIAPNSAGAEVRRARALRTMPHTAADLAEGALSPDHVDLLARVDSGSRTVVFADHEETLVEQCKLLRFTDACRMIAYWRLNVRRSPMLDQRFVTAGDAAYRRSLDELGYDPDPSLDTQLWLAAEREAEEHVERLDDD